MAIDTGIDDAGYLSANAVRAYGLIAAGADPTDEMPKAVTELEAWGCVTRDPAHGNRPVALDPEVVARRRFDRMLREADARVRELRELPAVMDQLAVRYKAAQLRAGGSSEFLDDPAVVNARLDDVVAGAEWEILAAQPGGPRTAEQLNRSLGRDTAALERGVCKRTLYLETVRDNPVTAEYARRMSTREGKRAEYRTLVGGFERAIVVDRKTAFVSNHLVPGAPEHAAWQITDAAMVAYIVAEFDARWLRANPWQGELRPRNQHMAHATAAAAVPGGPDAGRAGRDGLDGVRTTLRQREILRDMVAGRDQRATAGRLGISVRTVSDQIAELRDLFDAASREELAYKWAFSPDRLVDDKAPDTITGAGAVVKPAA